MVKNDEMGERDDAKTDRLNSKIMINRRPNNMNFLSSL
jgi:hypothetical protein